MPGCSGIKRSCAHSKLTASVVARLDDEEHDGQYCAHDISKKEAIPNQITSKGSENILGRQTPPVLLPAIMPIARDLLVLKR